MGAKAGEMAKQSRALEGPRFSSQCPHLAPSSGFVKYQAYTHTYKQVKILSCTKCKYINKWISFLKKFISE